jgi:hypothetical protein
MNSKQNMEYDFPGSYLNREKIEKAPQGFTERVMMQISMEKVPSVTPERSKNERIIAWVAILTSLVLIIIAGLTSSSDSLFFSSVSGTLEGLNIVLPGLNIRDFPHISLPGIVFYISTGIILLTLFDLALNRIFHRKS